jgi:hypothetical protein
VWLTATTSRTLSAGLDDITIFVQLLCHYSSSSALAAALLVDDFQHALRCDVPLSGYVTNDGTGELHFLDAYLVLVISFTDSSPWLHRGLWQCVFQCRCR